MTYDKAYIGRAVNTIFRLVPDGKTWSAAIIQPDYNLLKVFPHVNENSTRRNGPKTTIWRLLQNKNLLKNQFVISEMESSEYDNYIIDQSRKITTPGEVIYFISVQGTNLVKIGTTRNMQSRYIELRSKIPFSLDTLCVADVKHGKEKFIHRLFSEYLVSHEWFKLTPEIESFISKIEPNPVPFPNLT